MKNKKTVGILSGMIVPVIILFSWIVLSESGMFSALIMPKIGDIWASLVECIVSAFFYETPEELEKVFAGRSPGFAYTRIGNPSVDAFEKRVCELEGGKGAVACASGMSAVTLALLNILSVGDEVIAGSGLFGGTIDLFGDLKAFGITIKFVKHITVEEIAPLVTERTKVIFGEVIGNPLSAESD